MDFPYFSYFSPIFWISGFFCSVDGQGFCKLRWADSREAPEGSRTEPLYRETRFGALKIVNRRFEAIRANHSNVMKLGLFSANRFARIASIRVVKGQAIQVSE